MAASLVAHFDKAFPGVVLDYEIWNEPNFQQYWIGSTDQLIAMTREAHDIIKSIDPAAMLVSPSASTGRGVPWLADFLSKGGGRYVDAIGFHFYVHPRAPEALSALIERVKQTLRDNGAGDKPIWCTELGWAEPKPFPSDELAAGYLARSFILSWASGVQRLYWYAWDNHNWVSIETTQADNKTLRPAGQAYAAIQRWLVGTSMDSCNESNDSTWTCQLHSGSESQWIVWNADTTKAFTVPASWRITKIEFLLHDTQELRNATIEIGPVPELLTQSERPQAPTDLSASPRK